MTYVTYPYGPLPDRNHPGGAMTMPRKLPFPHVGGPEDGSDVEVEVDELGVPVEMHTLGDFTFPDFSRDPASGPASNGLRATYYREERPAGGYVFKFLDQVVIDGRSNRAA